MNPAYLPPNDQWAPSVELRRQEPPSTLERRLATAGAVGVVGVVAITSAIIVVDRQLNPVKTFSAGSDAQRSYEIVADSHGATLITAYTKSDGVRQPAALVDSRNGRVIPEVDRTFAKLNQRTVTVVDINIEGACSPSSLVLSFDGGEIDNPRRVSTASTAFHQRSVTEPAVGLQVAPDFCP